MLANSNRTFVHKQLDHMLYILLRERFAEMRLPEHPDEEVYLVVSLGNGILGYEVYPIDLDARIHLARRTNYKCAEMINRLALGHLTRQLSWVFGVGQEYPFVYRFDQFTAGALAVHQRGSLVPNLIGDHEPHCLAHGKIALTPEECAFVETFQLLHRLSLAPHEVAQVVEEV